MWKYFPADCQWQTLLEPLEQMLIHFNICWFCDICRFDTLEILQHNWSESQSELRAFHMVSVWTPRILHGFILNSTHSARFQCWRFHILATEFRCNDFTNTVNHTCINHTCKSYMYIGVECLHVRCRFAKKMGNAHKMVFSNGQVVMRKGALPKINICLDAKASEKKVGRTLWWLTSRNVQVLNHLSAYGLRFDGAGDVRQAGMGYISFYW